MSVTLSTTPTYFVAGQLAHVVFVASAGNFLRGYFTDAPIGSEIKTQLLNSGASRLPVFEIDADKPWDVTLDVGGIYSIQVEAITKGASGYGGGYEDSPDGFRSETIASTSTLTLSVGQKVTQKIGFGGDTATLTLFIVGNYVRPSSFAQHGFTSPLISDAKTPKALTASLTASIVSAVTALTDQSVTTLLSDMAASYSDLVAKFLSHVQSTLAHVNADADNVTVASDVLTAPVNPDALKRSVAKVLGLLDRHMRNDNGGTSSSSGGTGSGDYHTSSRADWTNIPLGTSAGDTLDTFVALADMWRAYEGHRQNGLVHPDTTLFPAVALPPLLDVHRLFLTVLAQQSPTPPPSVNAGVTALIHGAGFEES